LGGSWYHLYFLPALIQLLVALPLLITLVKTPARARVALMAAIAFLALGPLVSGASSPGSHSSHHHVVVALLSSSYGFVWIPFGLAGAAIGIGTLAIRRPTRWVAIGFVVFTLEALESMGTHTPPSTGYARAGLLVAAIGAIAAARDWSSPPRWLVTLGRYSRGVFLVHPLLLWVIRPVLVSSVGLWLLPVTVAGRRRRIGAGRDRPRPHARTDPHRRALDPPPPGCLLTTGEGRSGDGAHYWR